MEQRGCAFETCPRTADRRGYCWTHYQRWKSHGDPSVVLKPYGRQVQKTCSVAGCESKNLARSLCGKHYQRWKKYGDPLAIMGLDRSVEDRFWAFVDKDGPLPEERPELGPCWVWTGGLAEGYGAFWLDGRQVKAHIVSYTWEHGAIPDGQERDHLCRNRACCRPSHLEAVAHWTNVARGVSPHGVNAAKTHCKRGHPFDAANSYVNAKGSRVCRACKRMKNDEWPARKRVG